MNKKIISVVLLVCMMFSVITGSAFFVNAADTSAADTAAVEDSASVGASYGLATKVEDGNILHCFNWTLNQIKEELPNIAQAGFTSVQTSPLQGHDGQNNWYWLYQPSGFSIGNELGSYQDLKNLCSEADKYGIKVIVDVVANHLAGGNDGSWAWCIEDKWKNSGNFHNEGPCSNWDNRYDVTHKNIGMPDLNSENEWVQDQIKDMIVSLKNAGVDGIRWDAAKHIGLPSEGCGFWSKMASVGIFNYGEILDNPAGSSGDDYNASLMQEYANYIGVTDSSYSGHITGCVRDGKTDGWNANWANKGVSPSRIVYWAESHDTFCNNGWTNSLSESIIDRSYAILGARANSQALYFSRPYDHNHDSISYCNKGSTHYTTKEVAAINHFHNAMAGTGENFSVDNGCFVICRGGGAVIVSPNGSNFDITVANGGGMVPSGTYTDEVSGSTWTVSGSSISGHIGNTGIAVIYTQPEAGPSVHANPGSTTYKTDTLSVTLSYSNADSGSYSIDGGSFKSFTNGQKITIGSGVSYGSKTILTLKATKGSQTDQATYTYTKVDPNAAQTIYFDNSTYNWSTVWCYVYYDNSGTIFSNGEWPGVEMTRGSDNIFYYDVPSGLENGRAIFTENSGNNDHRYPGDGDPGLDLNYNSMIFGPNRSWTVYVPTTPVTPQPTQPQTPTERPTQPQSPTERPSEPGVPSVYKILVGDTDFDDSVTIFDATAIQRHLAGISKLHISAMDSADADRSGDVTILDATEIQRWLAGINKGRTSVGKYIDSNAPVQPENPTQPVVDPTQPVTPTQPPITSDSVILNAFNTSSDPEAWYAWTWNDGEGRWVKGEGPVNAIVFNGLDANVIFVRANPEMEIDWNNGSVWNQTGDLQTQYGHTFVTSGWSANRINGDWE